LVAACELVFPGEPGSAAQELRREVALHLARHGLQAVSMSVLGSKLPAARFYRRRCFPSEPPKSLDALRADTRFFTVDSATLVSLKSEAVLEAAATVAGKEALASSRPSQHRHYGKSATRRMRR
jgi:hypothetical protein